MVFGLSLEAFTAVHVLISMAAIAVGFVVVGNMIGGNRSGGLTHAFLALTAITTISGFGFPNLTVTPAVIVGGVSLAALAVAYWARGAGRERLYVISAVLALYLNSFVMVVQSFQKFPFLRSLAPTQAEAPFAITQLLLLVGMVYLGSRALKGYTATAPPKMRSAAA